MKIKRFEDIQCWQEARKLTKAVYRVTDATAFKRDFGLSQQIQRAAVSIMNNIAEGFDSASKPEFVKFLGYARRSASEVQCNLYVAFDQRYITQERFEEVYNACETVRKMITAFMKYLKKEMNSSNSRTR